MNEEKKEGKGGGRKDYWTQTSASLVCVKFFGKYFKLELGSSLVETWILMLVSSTWCSQANIRLPLSDLGQITSLWGLSVSFSVNWLLGLEEFAVSYHCTSTDRKSERRRWGSYPVDHPGTTQGPPRGTRGYVVKTRSLRISQAALRARFLEDWTFYLALLPSSLSLAFKASSTFSVGGDLESMSNNSHWTGSCV